MQRRKKHKTKAQVSPEKADHNSITSTSLHLICYLLISYRHYTNIYAGGNYALKSAAKPLQIAT